MSVCLCNGLTRRDVQRALAEGADSLGAVFRLLQAAPQCGRCAARIRDMLVERNAQQAQM